MNKADLIELLCSAPEGRIFGRNLLDSVAMNRCSAVFARTLFDNWLEDIKKRSVVPLDCDAAIRIFEVVAFTRSSARPMGFRLEGRLLPKDKLRTHAWHVRDLTVLLRRDMDLTQLESIAAVAGITIDSSDPYREMPALVRAVSADPPKRLRLREPGHIFRKDGCLWITNADKLVAHWQRSGTARDRLGLFPYKKGETLAAVRIDMDWVNRQAQASPTFADAGRHPRFRVRRDTRSLTKPKSQWGCTADLNKLALGKSNIDGRRERVVDPFPVRQIGAPYDIHFRVLKAIEKTRGLTSSDDHTAFETKVGDRSTHTASTLRAALQALLT